MACITPQVGNNGAGFIQTHTKLKRADQRSDYRLLKSILSDSHEATLALSNKTFPVLIGRADMPRLCNILEHVARGLYFHATKQRFIGKCYVLPAFISYAGSRGLELTKKLARLLIEQEQDGWSSFGDNPDVFSFRLGPTDQFGFVPMTITFFRGSKVYVSFRPEGVKLPFNTLSQATPDKPLKIDIKWTVHSKPFQRIATSAVSS